MSHAIFGFSGFKPIFNISLEDTQFNPASVVSGVSKLDITNNEAYDLESGEFGPHRHTSGGRSWEITSLVSEIMRCGGTGDRKFGKAKITMC